MWAYGIAVREGVLKIISSVQNPLPYVMLLYLVSCPDGCNGKEVEDEIQRRQDLSCQSTPYCIPPLQTCRSYIAVHVQALHTHYVQHTLEMRAFSIVTCVVSPLHNVPHVELQRNVVH